MQEIHSFNTDNGLGLSLTPLPGWPFLLLPQKLFPSTPAGRARLNHNPFTPKAPQISQPGGTSAMGVSRIAMTTPLEKTHKLEHAGHRVALHGTPKNKLENPGFPLTNPAHPVQLCAGIEAAAQERRAVANEIGRADHGFAANRKEAMQMPANIGKQFEVESKGWGTQVPFDAINDPGTYVCNWSGHLLRVPEDAIKPGRSPLMNICGTEPLFVTKISDDPYVAISKARLLAANCDQMVSF
jgi:hypothetical protein